MTLRGKDLSKQKGVAPAVITIAHQIVLPITCAVWLIIVGDNGQMVNIAIVIIVLILNLFTLPYIGIMEYYKRVAKSDARKINDPNFLLSIREKSFGKHVLDQEEKTELNKNNSKPKRMDTHTLIN